MVANAFFCFKRISQMLAGMLLSCSLDLSAQEQASAHNILILSSWDPAISTSSK